MSDVRFNWPTLVGTEREHVAEAIGNQSLSGDGPWTVRSSERLAAITGSSRVLLTSSCTQALELAAILLDLTPGDEVIMPSYTFVSTANAFVLRGAVPVFVDVEPGTMNIDAALIEAAVTERTRAIAVVHYAGVACAMGEIGAIAERHGLAVVEDAAQAIDARYEDRHLGAIGTFGTFSFHDTKNVTSGGEGGALLVNDERYWDRARIVREKGTNRSLFLEGLVDKYSWVDVGSSFLMAELNAAFLAAQLDALDAITRTRLAAWRRYRALLEPLVRSGALEVGEIPPYATHNAHLHFVKARDGAERNALIAWLREAGITAPFHYVPLHSAPGGRKFGRFHGEDAWTTREAARLVRLPLFHGIDDETQRRVVAAIASFYAS
ncbi:MAG: dTDP-4-amino-4,6-dideoxygalactose transaminase [Trueperaceae bacterium]|nr:dTDP-4-amino-4,6-dideoxygalactose transaminase [Trueperaceae bacterium]